MKKKSNRVILGLLILTLFLGVGFASVSKVALNITGNVSTKNQTLTVKFTDVDKKDATSDAYGSIADELNATITVKNLENIGDTQTVTYTVKNEETDFAALVKLATDGITNPKAEFFEVTTSVDSTPVRVEKNNGTATIAVTVKLIKVPLVDEDSTATISIKFDASATNDAASSSSN